MTKTQKSVLNPIHSECSVSILSSESAYTNCRGQLYSGFINLGAIILIVSNFRLIIEGIAKRGFPSPILTDPSSVACFACYIWLHLPLLLVYCTEAFLRSRMPRGLLILVHIGLNFCTLIVPIAVVQGVVAHFIISWILLCTALVFSMKQISFAHVMAETALYVKHSPVPFSHFVYFVLAPTLCFQHEYPRSSDIRYVWLLKRVFELVIGLSLIYAIVHHQMLPVIIHTLELIGSENASSMAIVEGHLNLAVWNLCNWLLIFYTLFQVYLNLLAEVLRFGDRSFYFDWWNAHTFKEYWRYWNLPVHNWMLRHVYCPLRNVGLSAASCTFCVFFVSGIGHEYIGSGCFHIWSYWSFLSILLQVPLVYLTEMFKDELTKSQLGNVFFWVMMCFVGLPFAILVYSYIACIKPRAELSLSTFCSLRFLIRF